MKRSGRSGFALIGGSVALAGVMALGAPSFLPARPSFQSAAHAAPAGSIPVAFTGLSPSALRAPSKIDYPLMETRLNRLVAQKGMVGMAVAVIENGEISYLKGFGETAAGSGERVGVRTSFRWASLSKGVAGTLVADLAAEGKLSLADPVARYSTSLRLPAGGEKRVTIADLLSHRVGLVNNAYDDRLEGGQDPRVIRTALGSLGAYCPPAQCHGYQNVAFDAASEIVEAVTGKRYEQVVRERLFAPLGMTSASMTRAGLYSSGNWARPHVGRTVVAVNDSYYRVPAAGGVNSSIFDLALWMRAQMGLAGDVVPQTVLAEAHSPRVATDRRGGDFNRAMGQSRYALGWRDYNYTGHRLVGHQGAVRGYRSSILFDPATKSGVAVLWNSQSGKPFGVQMEILDMLYGLERRDWTKIDGGVYAGGGVQTVAR